MDCKEALKIMPLFVGKELPADGMPEFKEHVDKCKTCQDELRLLEKAWDLLDNTDKINPSQVFVSKVWQSISGPGPGLQRTPLFRFPGVFPKWAPVFVMVFLLLIGGGGIYFKNIITDQKARDYALMTEYEDAAMFNELDMVEELELLEFVNVFEEADVIEAVEL